MKFEFVIENFINGNLKDFFYYYKQLKRTVSFWSYVKENYGEKVLNDAQEFLRKKGLWKMPSKIIKSLDTLTELSLKHKGENKIYECDQIGVVENEKK